MTEDEIRQVNMKRLENYSNALYLVIVERYKVLPLISTLSAALVSLALQGTTLVKTTDLAIIALFMLIALIPVSLFGILYQLGRDAEVLATRIKNIPNETMQEQSTSGFMRIFPWIVYVIFLVAIILVLLSFFNLR